MMLKFFNSVKKLHKNMRVCFNLNYHNNIRGRSLYAIIYVCCGAHPASYYKMYCYATWVWCTKKQRRQFLHFFYWKDAKYGTQSCAHIKKSYRLIPIQQKHFLFSLIDLLYFNSDSSSVFDLYDFYSKCTKDINGVR